MSIYRWIINLPAATQLFRLQWQDRFDCEMLYLSIIIPNQLCTLQTHRTTKLKKNLKLVAQVSKFSPYRFMERTHVPCENYGAAKMLQRVRRLRVAVARTSTAIKVNFEHVASRFRQSPVWRSLSDTWACQIFQDEENERPWGFVLDVAWCQQVCMNPVVVCPQTFVCDGSSCEICLWTWQRWVEETGLSIMNSQRCQIPLLWICVNRKTASPKSKTASPKSKTDALPLIRGSLEQNSHLRSFNEIVHSWNRSILQLRNSSIREQFCKGMVQSVRESLRKGKIKAKKSSVEEKFSQGKDLPSEIDQWRNTSVKQ